LQGFMPCGSQPRQLRFGLVLMEKYVYCRALCPAVANLASSGLGWY